MSESRARGLALGRLPVMRPSRCRRERLSPFRRIVEALFGREPRLEDRSDWGEPPPDMGVREPRRPRPSSSGGSAVLDSPTDFS
jgi:hypothetical protein